MITNKTIRCRSKSEEISHQKIESNELHLLGHTCCMLTIKSSLKLYFSLAHYFYFYCILARTGLVGASSKSPCPVIIIIIIIKALEVLRNHALQIDIYLLTYLLFKTVLYGTVEGKKRKTTQEVE